MRRQHVRRVIQLMAGGALLALALGACGAAEAPAPTATPARAPSPTPVSAATAVTVVATPTPIPTPSPIPTPTPTGKEPKYGGIAVIVIRNDPPSGFDILANPTAHAYPPDHSIFGPGGLTKPCIADLYLRNCPYLAETWETNPDFTQWTFKVRDKVVWHDGTPLTAEDVKWWIDRALKTPAPFPSFGEVKSVEVLGGNRVRITLQKSTPNYLVNVGAPYVVIDYPRHLMQPQIDKGNTSVTPLDVGLVGTGPFKLQSYRKGSLVSVRRFDKYWEKDEKGRQLPYLDGVDMPIIVDKAAALAAFRTGRVDATAQGLGPHLLPQDVDIVKKEMGDNVFFRGSIGGGWILALNTLRPGPLQDVRVRKAVYLAIDRAEASLALSDQGAQPYPLFMRGSPWANPDWETWPGYNQATKKQDQDEAKRLLAAAGFPNGFDATIACLPRTQVPECEVLEGQLRKVLGIRLTIEVIDDATWTKRGCDGAYEWRLSSHGTPALFPESLLASVASARFNPCSNLRHDDTKVEELLSRIVATPTHEERIKLSREAERYILLEKVYGVPLVTRVLVHAVRSYVVGLGPTSAQFENNDHTRVWLDK